MQQDITGAYYSIFIIVFSILSIYFRLNRRLLISSVTGIHIIFLFFFGIGPLLYSLFPSMPERVDRQDVINVLSSIYPYLLIGYALVFYNEFRRRNENLKNLDSFLFFQKQMMNNSNSYNFIVLLLSILGHYYSGYQFAKTGIGTLLPVLSYLTFPVTILITYSLRRSDKFSIYIFIFLVSYFGYQMFFSAWRSQLILFLLCFLIGLFLKNKLNKSFLIVLGLFLFLYVLPFQIIKRDNVDNQNFDFSNALLESIFMPMDLKFQYISLFFSQRINYSREIAYVQFALDNRSLDYKDGGSYAEIVLQLIPRFMWPEKPSYNSITGYEIPRKIGLLDNLDENSSWGVNCLAEFTYNFNYKFLPIFILFLFSVFNYFDTVIFKINLKPQNVILLQFVLFFISLNLVSLLYSSTYILWIFIIVWLINKLPLGSDANIVIR